MQLFATISDVLFTRQFVLAPSANNLHGIWLYEGWMNTSIFATSLPVLFSPAFQDMQCAVLGEGCGNPQQNKRKKLYWMTLLTVSSSSANKTLEMFGRFGAFKGARPLVLHKKKHSALKLWWNLMGLHNEFKRNSELENCVLASGVC